MHELTGDERDYLARLLKKRHDDLLHELHHAVTRAYKEGLREEIDLTERLQHQIGGVLAGAGV